MLPDRGSNSRPHHIILPRVLLGSTVEACAQNCKFGNFRENFIFANSLKRHIYPVKNSRLWHYIPTSVKDKELLPFREGLFSRNSASAKFRENKTLAKISEFTVFCFCAKTS